MNIRDMEPHPTVPGAWVAPVTGFYRLPTPPSPEQEKPLTWQVVPLDGGQ